MKIYFSLILCFLIKTMSIGQQKKQAIDLQSNFAYTVPINYYDSDGGFFYSMGFNYARFLSPKWELSSGVYFGLNSADILDEEHCYFHIFDSHNLMIPLGLKRKFEHSIGTFFLQFRFETYMPYSHTESSYYQGCGNPLEIEDEVLVYESVFMIPKLGVGFEMKLKDELFWYIEPNMGYSINKFISSASSELYPRFNVLSIGMSTGFRII